MKKLILIILINTFLQCQSQRANKNMIPIIDNRFEKFIKNINKSRIDEQSNLNYIIYTGGKTGYSEVFYTKIGYFKLIKNYYPSRSIENKGVAFNNGSEIGIWYFFDESGKLIKEENTDEGYDFKPKDVVKYCESHKIQMTKGYQDNGFQTGIFKREMDNKKVWELTYAIRVGKEDIIEQVILDGKTGKVLKREQDTYIGN